MRTRLRDSAAAGGELHRTVGRWRIAGLVVGAALVLSTPARTGALGLAWNPAPGAAGYRVRYGTSPDRLDRVIGVPAANRVVLHGLTDCTLWYASVTAHNAVGESAPSPVVASWPRPTILRLVPERASQGDELTLVIVGTNLEPGAGVELDNSGLRFVAPTASCTGLQAGVAIEPATAGRRPAQIGTFELQVRNPEGLAAGRVFEIVVAPSRFDVNRTVPSTVGRIDGADVVWVARRFASREGDGTYDPDLDFDGDGWIDGQELAWIGSNLGRCWSGSAWTHSACQPVPGASS